MNRIIAVSAAAILIALAGPANAKSVWDEISESAPRMDQPFVDIDLTAPRSPFTDLEQTAPRTDAFEDLRTQAP